MGRDVRISIRGSGIGNPNHDRGLLVDQGGAPLTEADGSGDGQIAEPLITRFTVSPESGHDHHR